MGATVYFEARSQALAGLCDTGRADIVQEGPQIHVNTDDKLTVSCILSSQTFIRNAIIRFVIQKKIMIC